jgi:hypothetical protein
MALGGSAAFRHGDFRRTARRMGSALRNFVVVRRRPPGAGEQRQMRARWHSRCTTLVHMRVLLVDTGAKRASVIEASLRQLDAVEIVRVAEAPSLGEAAAAWSPRGGGAVPPVSAGRERAARREGLDRGSQHHRQGQDAADEGSRAERTRRLSHVAAARHGRGPPHRRDRSRYPRPLSFPAAARAMPLAREPPAQ